MIFEILFSSIGLLVANTISGGAAGGFEAADRIAYEFFSQAMSIYEEEISDSKLKIQVLL